MTDTVKVQPLPYDYDALEPHIDAETMRLHHGKHYAGYVKKYNDAVAGTDLEGKDLDVVLADIDSVPEDIRSAVRNNGGGASNHAKFWEWMTPDSQSPSDELLEALQEAFGGFEEFQEKFASAATGQFGSGWAWLVVDSDGKLSITSTANQDTPISAGLTPVLGLDVWEHSYYKKYGPGRADYVQAWWSVVNWQKVEALYRAVAD